MASLGWSSGLNTMGHLLTSSLIFLTFNVDVEGLLKVFDKRVDISTVMTLFVGHCESFTDKGVWRTLGTLLPRMENVTLKITPLSPFLDALLEDPALATSRETSSSPFDYYHDDDDHYPRDSYSCHFDSDDSSCARHREAFPLFPTLWLLEIGANLAARRPKNHDIMEIIVRNSTNFTLDVLDEIRRAAPKLEIDWGCREDMELELEMEGDTQSDPESEEDTNTDDETDVDRECQDWYEE